MTTSSFENIIRMQFDSLMKLVIRRTVISYYREISRRSKHERPFCDMPDFPLNEIGKYDRYSSEYTEFSVFGYIIPVSDERLGKALKKLSERQRTIVLLFYYLDIPDTEIARIYKLSRSAVYRNRKKALNNLKMLMKGKMNDETGR